MWTRGGGSKKYNRQTASRGDDGDTAGEKAGAAARAVQCTTGDIPPHGKLPPDKSANTGGGDRSL